MIRASTALVGREGLERASALAEEITSVRVSHANGSAQRGRGVPLADRDIDPSALCAAAASIADLLERRGALGPEESAALRRADLARHLGPLLEWASGRRSEPPFEGAPVVWSVVRLALPAFIGSSAAREDPASDGRCPECAMAPDLAVLGATGARSLVCSACDTEWRFDRLRCPFCASSDQDRLGYLAGGVSGAVIRVCDGCGSYLKTVDRRSLGGGETPLLLRLITTGMDLSAERAGYHAAG